MNENEISLEEAQLNGSLFGLSAQEWAAQEGWTIVGGKTTVPAETTPPMGPGKPTPAGDSSLGITLLESPVASPPKSFLVEESDYGTRNKINKENERRELEYNNKYNVRTSGLMGTTKSAAAPKLVLAEPTKQESFDIEIEENDLELPAKKSNIYFNSNSDNSFVNEYYNAEELQSFGINIDDFQGYLNKNEFSKDFEEALENGAYSSKRIDGTREENQKTLNVARERALAVQLNNYIDETNSKLNKKLFLEKYNADPSAYNEYDNFDEAYASYLAKDGYLTSYIQGGAEQYAQNNFKSLTERSKEIQTKRIAEIKKQQEQGNAEGALDGIKNGAIALVEAFPEMFTDLSIMAQDLLGMDAYATQARAELQEKKLLDVKGAGSYGYVSGKSATVNNVKYIKDSKGLIYDINAGVAINEVTDDKTLNAINSAIEASGEESSDISAAGLTVQGGAVVGNVLAQILGTKGLGVARKAASLRYLAKAKGLKNAKQAKLYAEMAAKGGTNLRGISNAGTFGKSLPFNAAVMDATMFQSMYGALNGYEGTIRAAKQAGMSNEEAQELANIAALQMGTLYGITGPINPRIPALNKLDDLITKNKIFNKAISNYRATGNKQEFSSTIAKFAKNLAKAAPKTGKTVASEGAKETIQENIQQAGETLIVNKGLNEMAGEDFLNAAYSKEDIVNTSILSFAVGGLVGGKLTGFQSSPYQNLQNLYVIGQDLEGSRKRLEYMAEKGRITSSEVEGILEQAAAVHNQSGRIHGWLLNSNVDVVELSTLLQDVQNAENLKKRMDPSMHGPIDLSIQDTRGKIAALVETAAKENILKEAETVKKVAGEENITVYNTVDEMKAAGIKIDNKLKSDGFTEVDGKIVINVEIAAKTAAISVGSHELLHRILRSELKNNKAMPRIINEFRNILKSKGALKAVEDKLKTGIDDGTYDIKFNEDGSVSGNDIDEYITFFSDVIRQEEVPFEALQESEWQRIGRLIVNAFKTRLGNVDKEFTSGQQVFDFIKDYQRSIQKGNLTFEAKAKANSAMQVANDNIKLSKTQNVSAAAKEAKEVLEKVSSNMDSFDPNSHIIAKLIPGMAQAQLAKLSNKGLQFDMDEAVSDIIYRLYSNGDINKFDGRGTLYGYINGRISFRIKDMLKASGQGKNDIVEDFDQSNIEDLKGAAADVTTTEQIEERTEAERPTYRRLLDSRMASPALEAAMLEKIPRIVGTVKNRIDAPVSKNTTVTPLVNEIRLALGKQLDIDLKKAMGGKKDGVLRRFLTDNKKAILENMTTTYLMSAFPAAIQKKVNGVFTSDWKGKKIDRETTSTDQAGRTSGAEVVRRLPNASVKIDDKTFLSFILDEKGNPLRGKKESLAKAISEEMAIEFIIREMKNPDSVIRQAFEANQERLDVELDETFVTELEINFERGNVKYKKSDISDAKSIIDLVEMALIAKKEGYQTRYARILYSLPKDIREMLDDHVKELIGTGKGQFASTLKKLNVEDNIPLDNLLDAYLELNKKENKKRASELGVDFANKLLDALSHPVNGDPYLLSLISNENSLGLGDNGFILKGTKGYAALNKKIAASRSYGKRPTSVLFKGAYAFNVKSPIVTRISDILYFDDLSVKEKLNSISEKDKKMVEKANVVNPLAFNYLMQAAFDIIENNPDLGPAFMMLLQKQTALRGVWTQLTTLTDIQVFDGPQAPYYNTKTGEYLLKSDGSPDVVFNPNHPLLNDALNFEGKKNVADLLLFKNEHGWTSMKQMAFSIAALSKALALDPNGKINKGNKTLFSQQILKLARMFNQQISTNLSSEIQDKILGRTSEAGYNRMLTLPSNQLNSFYDIETGKPVIEKINEETSNQFPNIDINEKAYLKNIDAQALSVKFSMSKPTAVFMVGGAGSGKSSVIKNLDLVGRGYRLINQDPYLEKYIREEGLPTDESTYTKEQRSTRAKLGWKARKAAEEDLAQNTAAKESMVVDGTGASYKATTKKMKALEAAGFDVHMIFVNTSKDIASNRNAARTERSLPDFVVKKNWDQVQESAQQYREDYPAKFYEVNTDNLKYGEALPEAFVNQVNTGLEASGVKFSKGLSEELNSMIERNKGVAADKVYSNAQARMQGERKGKYRLFVPSSAEDFRGLTSYTFAGKGKQGEADQKFIEDNLITPYLRGIAMIEAVKQQVRREYNALAKESKQYFKMLGKKIGSTDYTYDQALRVYMWTQQSIEVPGMSKDDIVMLIKEINQIPGLIELGNAMQLISRQDTWAEPGDHWLSRTLISDLNGMTEKVGRKKYLQEFIENSEAIFSNENLNKIEAVYGTRHREAIVDALYAMTNGTNRVKSGNDNKQVNEWLNWVNNSTGAIMFFNVRSAVLQTLSATNFINWSDNNPLKAAAAFANQPQYWSDFAMIFNSDKLKQRRSGLQTDVNQAEIANQAEGAKDKAGAVIAYLLKIGFTPTQIADSFAISMGGATFYRNRVKTYLKEGMEQAAAEKQAFEDFSKTADEAQQSSDPYLVSQEQRSVLGRLVLAFQNTPMQYTRLMKKSMQDLANGRGDAKTHISKIIYYGAVQNFIFSALQSALFAVIPGFDDEDESEMTEKELEKRQRKDDKRNLRIINSMTDSILKGSGVRGAALATIKNTITEYFAQKEKGFMADRGAIILQALSLSPPIGSKLRKINSALAGEAFNKDVLEARGFSVMKDGRINLSPAYSIIGSLVSGVANVPMDRMVDLINGYSEALDSRNTIWQRIALGLGWKTWDVGAKNEEHDLIKAEGKEKRKEEGKAKAKKTREENRKKKEAERKAKEKSAEVYIVPRSK
jgi:chloramphenicol 3-O-phosphotransferase